MGLNTRWIELPVVNRRLFLFSVAAASVFLLLALRLWYLQIISYDRYTERSTRNRTRVLSLAAPRGPIYDRDGVLLVDNRPAFTISVMRQDVSNLEELLQRLAGFLETDVATLNERWARGSRFPIYRPVPLATDVSREITERVLEHSTELPGVLVEVFPVRDYLEKGSEAHLVGYLGEVTENELSQNLFEGLQPGDYVGKSALEKAYEPYLRGRKGKRLVEVDVKGRLLRPLEVEQALPGNKVFLTISQDVQRAADQAFGDQSGAAVALDVRTGEVLAILSRPTFDPALFARGIESEEWTQLLKDSRHPLQNKALSGLYSPASTFKMMVALGALREGIIDPQQVLNCDGSFSLGKSRYRCWKKGGHGRTDLTKALRESCDVYFYQVGLKLGIDKLSEVAREFGLDAPTGFPLAGEKAGVIPSTKWKSERFNKPWYAGETVIASIGQGYVLVTPIQLAVMTAALANHGDVLQPQIIRKIEDWKGNVLQENVLQVARHINFPEDAWQAIDRGLVAAVNEPHGTASSAHLNDIKVAGKTGTAQVVRRQSDEEEEAEQEEVPYRFRSHALFVAYAPTDNPEIAVAVVVEHGQHGGSAAGPIARAMLDSYFKGQPQKVSTIMNEGG